MENSEIIYTEIRKLRKKLRQIENLEKAQRPLNSEEQAKIQTKHSLRSLLQEKLKCYKGSDPPKPQPTYSSDSHSPDQHTYSHDSHSPEQEEVQEFVSETHHELDEYIPVPTEELSTKSSQIDRPHNTVKDETPADIKERPEGVSLGMQRQTEGSKQQEKAKQSHGASGDNRAGEARQNKGRNAAAAARGDALKEVNPWDKVKFTVTELVGHNDIICSVDCCQDTVVSGSRDTSIKVWDASSGSEVRSLGGHTDSVTAVVLVPIDDCQMLAKAYNQKDDVTFIISSSLDCSIKLWVMETGEMVKSIYTFNAVTCLGYFKGRHLAATAYSGGKVELWNMLTGESSYSVIGHDEAVTSLKVSGDKVVTACGDGVIKLWELRGNSLHPIFVSENVKPALPRMRLIVRKVHTAVVKNRNIYIGDDGHNVKVLDWREGVAHKLRNHKDGNEFGLVDSILVTSQSNYLVCSGYDIDLGNGYLNFFSLEDEKYLATLTDDSISRVFTLAYCTANDGHTRLVTGGAELKVWDVAKNKSAKGGKTVTAFYNQEFTRRARDSEEESDDESSDGEDQDDKGCRWSQEEERDEKQESSWWCSVI